MLSIIITHYKTPHLLKLSLRSIEETCKDMKPEIIVSESEVQDETKEILEHEFPHVKHLAFTENVGYAKLVNGGILNSQGEYILILNADIVLLDNTVEFLVDFLTKHDEVGMVGPKLLNFNDTHQYSCFKFYRPFTVIARRTFLAKTYFGKKEIKSFLMLNELNKNANKPLTVDWLMGSIICVKRSAVNKVGLLDERFFMYFEDVDWCRRFWENGLQVIYYPKAQAYHYHQKASDAGRGMLDVFFNKQTRIHASSAIKYFKKYRGKSMPALRSQSKI
ncbi:MAG TPA: glycosyltransferase family 2 protein [Candidatus Paceibacterota bacterium]